MKTELKIERISKCEYKFQITFKNNENSTIVLPFDRLKNSAERVGLRLESDGKPLTLAKSLIVSKKEYHDVTLRQGEQVSMELIATIKSLWKSHWGLFFDKATYQIFPGKKCRVWFSLNGLVSDPVEVIFETDNDIL